MPANEPSFQFRSPTHSFQTHGLRTWLAQDWNTDCPQESLAALRAAARGRFIVGAIPFDTQQPPALFEPDSVVSLPPLDDAVCPETSPAPEVVEDADLNEQRAQNFTERTAAALTALDDPANPLEKVVLGRLASWQRADQQPFDPQRVFDQLCAQNPGTYHFAFHGIPKHYAPGTQAATTPAVLTGASPELVLEVTDQQLQTHPLAGSLPAGEAQALQVQGEGVVLEALYTEKNRAEHAHVTRDIAARLQPFCPDLAVPETPAIVRTPTVWHLGTHIQGTVAAETDLLDLLYAVHPTPAVSGFPQQVALKFLREHGVFDRGLFSGVVGWLDQRPGHAPACQWAMTLRCGIIQDATAVAFAGAGIVSGSDPQAERLETRAKLTTFARALY